jgi:hypothetical protein|tara:strand:+ start:47 stop:652 length:606 start_codon:yes stop_codon:yes gene_type:complete
MSDIKVNEVKTDTIKNQAGTTAMTISGGTVTFSNSPSGILTQGTAVTTSGSAEYGFTGIPSTVTHIKFLGVGVSRGTGTGSLNIQLGDSGGYETTGYTYNPSYGYGGGGAAYYQNAVADQSGARLALYDESITFFADIIHFDGNQWIIKGQSHGDAAAGDGVLHSTFFTVSKTLSGVLDRVRIIDTNGTNLDGGKIKIIYG